MIATAVVELVRIRLVCTVMPYLIRSQLYLTEEMVGYFFEAFSSACLATPILLARAAATNPLKSGCE